MENRVLPHISALFTMLVWGVTFVCTKVLLGYLGPLDILLARTVLGFAALCLGAALSWAVVLLGDPMTPGIMFGFVLVIVGLVLSEGFDLQVRAWLRERKAG